jgi:hypothetical protein
VIAWCRECKTNLVNYDEDGDCSDCFMAGTKEWETNTYAFRLPLGPYRVIEWFAPREFNTVDLKQLQKDRLALKYRGWGTR